MVSRRRLKLHLLFSALVMATTAAACMVAPSVSWVWLWALAGGLAACEFLRSLWLVDVPALPAAHAAPDTAVEGAAGAVLALLEHAPVALFRVEEDGVDPLNVNAHRVAQQTMAHGWSELCARIRAQQVGQRTLVWFDGEHGAERALLTASALVTAEARGSLVALVQVENELEAETLSAWRELTHVLTHEIMNSLTPVASLSHSAQSLLHTVRARLPADVNDDLVVVFDTIARRTASLSAFVDSYRSLSSVPPAQAEPVRLHYAFQRMEALVAADWAARDGQVLFSVEPVSLELRVDPGQFEQAMLNLLQNAAEATAGVANPRLEVRARNARDGCVRIDVWDNGHGVPADVGAHIFKPFFSTKEAGSGVGLAVVRQLLHGNGGTVRHYSPLQGGALFSITFQGQ